MNEAYDFSFSRDDHDHAQEDAYEEVQTTEYADTDDDGPEPTIREDIPLPAPGAGRRRSSKWKFIYELEVGQSAHFEFESDEEMKNFRKSAASIAVAHGRKEDKKFSIRQTDTGLGVWRLA